MWTTALCVVLTSLTTHLTHAQVCGDVPIVWRNNNQTCPPRAICADVFNTIRDWYNGTTCPEKRTLHNCFCGSGMCPVNDESHQMYASQFHRIYTCEPVCRLPWCANVRSTGDRTVAVVTEQSSPTFSRNTYQRVDCRCPRHHRPSIGNGILHHAVKSSGNVYNPLKQNYQTQHVCRNSIADNAMNDPCPAYRDTVQDV
ncbi:hypothetical protein BgiMline_033097 [Biomphalaria glabrata]|uniref:Uncharacterized protein LOC106066694 n=1 Tax=Biomphalaria glabrata TaxID=6526 RepID=A0A9W2Z1H8_BIOGL|nr:uncharacterized protein LOC106066694 [Biomphalaria glabrata]XP_055868803.1 uncharacterized protein LOC106066694 [Biomphalaria glabrata]KAI8751559.1 CAunnamed protein product [Biomphalaria glabrata]